jgi:Cu(I)/Ag(I) efflux system membrane fusion protein
MKRYWRKNNEFSVDNQQLTRAGVKTQNFHFTLSIACCQLSILILLTTCSQNKHAHTEQYTCPMHPTVVKDTPGTCPVCGMELVLKQKRSEEKIANELNYLLQPVNSSVVSSIKTVTPLRKSAEIKTRANGIITYDTRSFTTISSRISGRVEKLFVRYNFQPIKKGQKILEIYSPELLTAQRDLLYLLKSDKENSQLIDGAKEKLGLLGATDQQINQLVSTGKESASFSIYSPTDGYIVNSGETQSELDVREGMYVTASQTIFKVANAKNVWAEFDLYSKDASLIKVNDPIQITVNELKEEIEEKVNFVEPFYKEGENFFRVRVYVSNPNGKYRIGQLISATFNTSMQESLWIPATAQLDLGTKRIVFIKREDTFEPIGIITGNQSNNLIEVLKGIDAGDSVAYNAQFMIDSESFIKIKK